MKRLVVLIVAALVYVHSNTSAETVSLATNHSPSKTIRIPNTASTALQSTANSLAGYLGQICGGTFVVQTYDPATGPEPGIILGKSTDLNFTSEVPEPIGNMKIRERFVIGVANSSQYVFLIGATDLALQDAVYYWLEVLECRWFFASPNWTIIPSNPNLAWTTPSPLRTKNVTMGTKTISMNLYADETPAYKMRMIWAEYLGTSRATGDWRQQELDWNAWCVRNRAVNSYTINAGHAYDSIITWAKQKGLWNDQYYALINGVRNPSGQLSLGQIGVQELLRSYTQEMLAGAAESVSLEPKDGSAWGTDPLDEAIAPLSSGFVTDRVITANNYAATVVPPGKFIGMYAYNMHSAPPSMAVSDKIYVLIATAFLTHGNTVNSLLAGWSAKAQNIGLREYYSVWDWDYNLPGTAQVADIDRLKRIMPYYHMNNVDAVSAESTDGWGPLGLGFYLSAKLLWNPNADAEALKNDFLSRAFGPAAETMRLFYDHIDSGKNRPLSGDLIGRLYRFIATARGLTSDPGIVSRLNDLALYVHYIELALEYGTTSETVLRYVWKIKNSNMVSSLACWRNYTGAWPQGKDWKVKYPDHPWKENHTFTQTEIDQLIEDGVLNYPLLPVEPRSYSGDMLLIDTAAGTSGVFRSWRSSLRLFIKADSNGILPTMTMASGFSYTNRGDMTWSLYTENGETLLESGSIPPDKVDRSVTFALREAGKIYQLVCKDGKATSTVSWPAGSKVTITADSGSPLWLNGRASRLYFYVPKGVTHVVAFADTISDCIFKNAAGATKLNIPSTANNQTVVIPVDTGEDDQIWYVANLKAMNFEFYNIPPFFALNKDELLVPRDAYSHLVPSGQPASTFGSTGALRMVNNFYLHTRPDGTLPPLTISNGLTYNNRNLNWTLYGEDGTTQLQTGIVPANQVPHVTAFDVPARPGTYRVKMDDNAASYTVAWTPGDSVSVAADSNSPLTTLNRAGRLYFYVPKGAQSISFSATSCSDCKFYDGAGTLVYSYPGGASGSVTVPVGKDGQIWSVNSMKASNFRFLNIPGILARNKDELLVERWTLLP